MAEGDTTTGTTGTTGESWTSSLPEAIRGHESLKSIPDVGTLASKYLEVSTPKPFAEQLPEKIRGEAAFKDIKDLAGLADSYFNAQKMIGIPKDQLLRLPTDDKPENWGPVYDKLGRPVTPDKYDFKAPEGAPEVDPEFKKRLFTKAHEIGITSKQLNALYGFQYAEGAQHQQTVQAARDAAIAERQGALKTEWGAAHGVKMQQAISAAAYYDDALGLKGELKKAAETEMSYSPTMAKLFAALAGNLAEDGKLTGKSFGSEALASPAEAMQKINALKGDQSFMKRYTDSRDPGHADAVKQMTALYEQAHPRAA